LAALKRSYPGVAVAVVGRIDFQRRCPTLYKGPQQRYAGPGGIGGDVPMQDRRMRGIDTAFQGLPPVALLPHLLYVAMALRHLRPLEIGGWWHFLCRPHVGPNSSTNLDSGIRCGANLMGEAALGWFIHLVHTLAGHIELPAVIHAAQARLLVAPKPQRHQTVWTELVQQPNAPLGIAKGYELLAQELHADWRAIRFK